MESQLKEYSAMLEKGPSSIDSDQRVRELEQQLIVENKRVLELESKLKVATSSEEPNASDLRQAVKKYEGDLKEKDERISHLTKRVAELEAHVNDGKSSEMEPSSVSKFEVEIETLRKRVAELEASKPAVPKRPTRTPTNPPERPVVPPKVNVHSHQSPVADAHNSGTSSEETAQAATPETQQSEETEKKRGNMTRQPSKAFLERKRFFEGRGPTPPSKEKEDEQVAPQ